MNEDPRNKFREAEKINLVPEPELSAQVRQPLPINSANWRQTDEKALTPWKKQREKGKDGGTGGRKFVRLAATAILIAPLVAFALVLGCVPRSPGWVVAQYGILTNDNSLVLAGYKMSWGTDPTGAGMLLGLANERAASDKKGAMELYDNLVRLSPNYPNGWMNRGLNYAHLNDDTKALVDYDKAIALDPHYALAYNNKGCVYLEKQKFDLALKNFALAKKFDPTRFDYPYNMALVFERTHQKARALEELDLADKYAITKEAKAQLKQERDWINANL